MDGFWWLPFLHKQTLNWKIYTICIYMKVYTILENIYLEWSIHGLLNSHLPLTKSLTQFHHLNYIICLRMIPACVSQNESIWEGKETILKSKLKDKETISEAEIFNFDSLCIQWTFWSHCLENCFWMYKLVFVSDM